MAEAVKGKSLRTVLRMAVGSRLLVAFLFILWRNVANSYDTSAQLSLPCLSKNNNSSWPSSVEPDSRPVWGQRLGQALENTIVWDGVYYVRIAECGYEYEQTYAFLPTLPILMRFLSQTIFYKLVSVLGLRASLALSGYFINNVAFVLAAYFLYRLSDVILADEKYAVKAVALFCFNPASTFYSALYSESLFALVSFAGLLQFVNGARWTAITLFGISSGIRSNGVLHAGFILFQAMHKAYKVAVRQGRFLAVLPIVLVALIQSVAVAAPFVAFQRYGFSQLCSWEDMPGLRPWCKATIPYLYGFVQSYYWDVGFLRYFQFKQLPNFLLASPMLSLALGAIFMFAKHQPRLFFSLGLAASCSTQAKVALTHLTKSRLEKSSEGKYLKKSSFENLSSGSAHHKEMTLRKREQGGQHVLTPDLEIRVSSEEGFHSPAIICFLFQLCFMVATAVFVMHVQVATRFLSVSPPIYWYGSHVLHHATGYKSGNLIWTIFFCYTSVGSLLFINFYPFT